MKKIKKIMLFLAACVLAISCVFGICCYLLDIYSIISINTFKYSLIVGLFFGIIYFILEVYQLIFIDKD